MCFIAISTLFFIIGILSFGFFSNFDITDEGFYLYFHQNGTNIKCLTNFQIFTHPLGALFNHSLLAYRFLNLFLIIFAGMFLAYAVKRFIIKPEKKSKHLNIIFFSLIVSLSLGFFITIPSLGYNAIAVLCSMFWLVAMLYWIQSRSMLYIIILAFFCMIAVVNKISSGMLLFLSTPVIMIFLSYVFSFKLRRDVIIFLFLFFLFFGFFLIFVGKNYLQEFVILMTTFKTNPDLYGFNYMLLEYLREIKLFLLKIIKYIIPPILVYYLIFKSHIIKNNDKVFKFENIFICGIVFYFTAYSLSYVYLFSKIRVENLLNEALTALMSISIVVFWGYLFVVRKNIGNIEFKKRFVLFILCSYVAFLHPLGTNTNIIYLSACSMGIWGVILVVFLYDVTNQFKEKKFLIVTSIVSIGIILSSVLCYSQILFYRRNAPYNEQTTYSKYSPYLKGIALESDIANNIDNLILTLKKIDFDFKQDRIFAAYEVPGYLSAVGAKAFGTPWNMTGYGNAEMMTKKYVELDITDNIRYIYFLRTGDLQPDTKKYLLDILEPADKFVKEMFVCKGYFYDNGKKYRYNLVFEGPYRLRKK